MSHKKRRQVDASASSKKQKARAISNWRDVFRDVPYSQYFAGLSEARDMNHADYFRFIKPPYNMREYWENVWVGQILKIVQSTDIQCVHQQHRRLTIEWEKRGVHDDVWLEILTEEFKHCDEELNLVNQMNAKKKAVTQIDAAMNCLIDNAVEAFSTSQEELLEKLGDDLDPELDSEFSYMPGGETEDDIGSEFEAVSSSGTEGQDTTESVGINDLQLPSSDPCDPTVTTELLSDGTIEQEPEPVRWDRLVGPGTLSCARMGGADYVNDEGRNISGVLMRYRQEQIEDSSFLGHGDIEKLLSLNFIFFKECLRPLREQQREQWKTELPTTQLALIVEWSQAAVHVEPGDIKATLCEVFARGGALKSPAFSCLDEMCGTGALWSSVVLNTDNEDSHIARFVRPFVESIFGFFPNCKLCWTRDVMETGNVRTGEMLQPDFMLCSTSKPQYTFMVGEVKKFDGNDEVCHKDRHKLFTEMKMCLDGLLDVGVDGPVIGILAQRHRVEVWSLTLPYEALYLPTLLGAFDLVLSRFSFASTIVMFPPLLAARAAVADTLARFASRRKRAEPIKSTWRRGTYHVRPQEIKLDITMKQEVQLLWDEEEEAGFEAEKEAEAEEVETEEVEETETEETEKKETEKEAETEAAEAEKEE
ncbi:hypothetical protein BGX28_009308 [Mortierella sp. GBA30]|nr:hypothetical protein BGX28_009308 [Mortierella sp. GBA30]